jgi:hypothetical protein
MKRCLLAIFVASIAIGLAGCSYLCRFEARGSVRDALSGRPIAAAKVELVNADGNSIADTTTTNARGKFEMGFETSPSPDHERKGWKLVLTAKGYKTERMAIGTIKEPKNGNETVYFIFRASMRRTH